jgi:hypothetical protein
MTLFALPIPADAIPLSVAWEYRRAAVCQTIPKRASERSYEERYLAAHRIAAEVRARRSSMQVKRVTPWLAECLEWTVP